MGLFFGKIDKLAKFRGKFSGSGTAKINSKKKKKPKVEVFTQPNFKTIKL